MLLDQDGDLVRPPSPRRPASVLEQTSVALDPRVGANIRLGDDPAALPPNMLAQAEPHIVRSQVNPDFIVATFQEGRFTNGGAVDCGYSVTRDGGLTWTRALIPGLTQAVGGPYYRASDPVAGIDLNGNIYLNTDAATDPKFDTSVIVVSRSTDGGATFGAPVVAYDPAGSAVFPDKNWMAINTFPGTGTTGRIVVTFTEFASNFSPIARVFSDDGGQTWSAPAFVHASNTSAQGSQPVFLPDGRLAIIYWNFGSSSSPGERLEVVVSTDGGVSFGAPRRIANATEYNEPSIRSGAFLPSATTDRATGALCVVYQARLSNAPKILFTKSTNGGISWSTPIPISNNPTSSGVFNPAIASSPDGQTLTVSFYDHRNNPGSTTLVDLYLAQSFDGGATWQPNIRLTSVSTDASIAPLTSSGYMLGDYLGIAETTNANVPAVPVFIDTRTGNPDPFVTRVGVAPQLDFTSWEAARLSFAQINQPGIGGESGDADGDGEDNLSEFRSMTDPQDANSIVRSGKDLNISTRARVETGDNVLIGGFIITGTEPATVLVRAIGPSLTSRGVTNVLPDPTLELHDHTGAAIAFNDNWRDAQAMEIEATNLAPGDDREAALLRTLAPGGYTAIVRGKGDGAGVALAEIYDLSQSENSKLGNLSTRGFVNTGDDVMIGGFIVGGGLGTNGSGSARVVVRGIGPSLAQAGISNALQDPTLELHDGNGAIVAANDNWRDSQEADIQSTNLAPSDNREAAILAILRQGGYTAIVRGKNTSTGVALVEVFNVP